MYDPTGASGLSQSPQWVYVTGREGRHLGYLKRQPLVSYLAIRTACPGPRLYMAVLSTGWPTGTRTWLLTGSGPCVWCGRALVLHAMPSLSCRGLPWVRSVARATDWGSGCFATPGGVSGVEPLSGVRPFRPGGGPCVEPPAARSAAYGGLFGLLHGARSAGASA